MSRQGSNFLFSIYFPKESKLSTTFVLLFDVPFPFCDGPLSNKPKNREPSTTPIRIGQDIRPNRATRIVSQLAVSFLGGKRVVKAIASEARLEYGPKEPLQFNTETLVEIEHQGREKLCLETIFVQRMDGSYLQKTRH